MAPASHHEQSIPAHRLRASDQERHEAVLSLSDHYAEGRLDLEEFTARMELAQQVVHIDELDPLFADLPPRRTAPEPAAHRRHPSPPPWLPVALLVIVVLSAGAIAGGHFPWWLIPLAWFVAVRRLHGHHHPERYRTR